MKITIKQGVTMELTAPQTYEVNYLDGKSEYTEPFVIINFTKTAADQELKGFRTIIDGLAAFFITTATGGAAASMGITVAIGATLSLITKVAGPLIEDKLFGINPDGSITQYMAYHYWGSSTEGIDPTAWPIPGVDPNDWFKKVNSSITSFKNPSLVKVHTESLHLGIETSKQKPNYEFKMESQENFLNYSRKSLNVPIVNLLEAPKPDLIAAASDINFSESFKSCMDLQGLPTPSSIFGTVTTAVANINAIYSVVVKYGASVTIKELIAKGVLGEGLAIVGSMTAAYYLGACIGCGIYAGIGSMIPSPI